MYYLHTGPHRRPGARAADLWAKLETPEWSAADKADIERIAEAISTMIQGLGLERWSKCIATATNEAS